MLPRALRFMLFGFEIRRWRLCATPALILPVAVREKRFLAPLLVFILGIFILSLQGFRQRTARHARLKPAVLGEARVISAGRRNSKGGRRLSRVDAAAPRGLPLVGAGTRRRWATYGKGVSSASVSSVSAALRSTCCRPL